MTNIKNLISAMAFTVALAPMAGAAAFSYGAAQDTAYLSQPAGFNQLAANSKGRPAEFAPAGSQLAANSKGRPAEFAPASSQLADNSKDRSNAGHISAEAYS